MSDPVEQFVAGLASLGAAPDRRLDLIVYGIEPVDGAYAGRRVEVGVEVGELANWPIAPPHWIHLPAEITFARTNSQPSSLPNWMKHSRQVTDWGGDPQPTRVWMAHTRGVVGEAR